MKGTKPVGLFFAGLFVGFQICFIVSKERSISSDKEVSDEFFSPLFFGSTVSRRRDTARDIVERSYNATFALFENCDDHENFQNCVQRIYESQKESSHLPWWFRTMLRDASDRFLHAGWHNITFVDNAIELCSIEKNGSTEWRKVSCEVNKQYKFGNARIICHPIDKYLPSKIDRVVFLRDPLTRFLSAFMNKCIGTHGGKPSRLVDPHCEPHSIFKVNTTANPENDLISDFLVDKHLFFEAYVSVIPLKWNMHFFPQSLYCNGIYRNLNTYKFIGNMGSDFHEELIELGQIYGEPLNSSLYKQFSVGKKHREKRNQAALKKILEFYSPRTIRRVLEYLSIDYIRLDLPIPEWVDEILLSETETLEES